MSQVLVINSLSASDWVNKGFSNGKTAVEMVESFLSRFPSTRLVELINPGSKGLFSSTEKIALPNSCSSLIGCFQSLFKTHSQIIYLWADTPLLEGALTDDLIAHHDKYLSQYTFSDGWPQGLTPEILEKSALEKLEVLARDNETPLERDTLFTLIQKDINAFDLETVISPRDFRLLRLLLAADSKANWTLIDRFIESGLITGEAIASQLEKKQPLLRTLPAFYQLQITEKRHQIPSYLPQPDFVDGDGEVSLDDFKKVVDKIAAFSPGAVISLSYWGEASCHSKIYELMEIVLKADCKLLIETSGLGWDQSKLGPLLESQSQLDWIVELDALDPALYKTLRGDGQEEALSFIDYLGGKDANLYVQTTRMIESEDHLESLYHTWKERKGELIIKKYDHFCKALPSKKITDLSPIKRTPCWHLKRDMVVLMDGTVLFCQEALDKSESMGNLLHEDILEIWKRGEKPYLEHLGEELPSRCLECDEYYTYNF